MFSTKILLLIIAGIVVAGGGVYLATKDNATSDSMMHESDKQMNDEMQDLGGEGTFRSLLALGQNLHCSFSYADEGNTTDGEVFIAGERMRGDFTVTSSEGVMNMHTIRTGTTAYVWGETPYGMMANKFDLHADNEGDSGQESNEGVDLDQKVTYDCQRWSPDTSKFTPPSDVQFQDFSAHMDAMMDANTNVQGAQCGACAQIPDANARAQCEAALGC